MPINLHPSPNYDLPTSTQIGTVLSDTEWNEAEKVMSNINGNGYLAFSATSKRTLGGVWPICGAHRKFIANVPMSRSLSSFIAPGMNRFYGVIGFRYHINIYMAAFLTVGGSDYKIFEMDKALDNNFSGTVLVPGVNGLVGTDGSVEVDGTLPDSFRAFGQSKTAYLKLYVDLTDRGTIPEGTQFTTNPPYSFTDFDDAVFGFMGAQLWFYKDCSDEC
ncbi:MAG: hypothetical protein GWN62_16845 [Aliifodinibius sp.]|nr:hypothetical protein [Fodinibius sp.]